MIIFNAEDISAAREGNRVALSTLLKAAEKPVYNLAIRMLAHPQDAEDATQEILIKIITNLSSLRDLSAAGAWAMRIACRHLIATNKGRVEAMNFSFLSFAEDLEDGLSDLTSTEMAKIETQAAIEEVKVACTLAMLICLNRDLRIAYLLSEVFGLDDIEAAEILEIQPASYRQRLKRGREAVSKFVLRKCGNVSSDANCRCERRVKKASELGRITGDVANFQNSNTVSAATLELRPYIQGLEDGRRSTALFRSNPEFASNITALVLKTIEPGSAVSLDHRK